MVEKVCRAMTMVLAIHGTMACEGSVAPVSDAGTRDAAPPPLDAGAPAPPDATPVPRVPGELVEDPSVYERDDLEVLTAHVTVTDLDGLEEVHDNVPGAEVDVLFQAAGFAEDATGVNAEMRLRGITARFAEQKSYRIKLFSKTNVWRGHRIIHLNKHQYDLTRVRQKLSFDYFAEIRHLTSLRTAFVRLYINGEDMGLYTQIERPDERFLAAHGLDPAGQVYKAKNFTFQEIPDEAWESEEALEEYLEVKSTPDHAKFREMLAAVHDWDRDIDEIVDTYFQRENYLTWLAMNMLMGNFDTIIQNYMLYSPSDSSRWYFMTWDYDDSWGVSEQPGEPPRARNKSGIGNWWFPTLHERFLREPANVADLTRMVEHLADEVITPERTAALLAQYHDVVREHVEVPPDIEYLPASGADTDEEALAMFEQEYALVPQKSEQYREEYRSSLHWPMPVWLMEPQVDGEQVTFEWSESYDLQGDGITYDLLVSTSMEFEEDAIVARRTGLEDTEVTLELSEGAYFARVIARDDDNPEEHWQQCGNSYFADEDTLYWGLRPVVVD